MARRRDIEHLQSEVEELFADLWQLPHFMGSRRGFRPAADAFLSTARRQLVVTVEIAGAERENLSVVVEGRELVVGGERRLRDREEGRVYQLMELEDGPFERRIPLGPDVDVERAAARYKDGLLTIVFPLAKPRKAVGKLSIEVRAE
jgi:HSP20 family protein